MATILAVGEVLVLGCHKDADELFLQVGDMIEGEFSGNAYNSIVCCRYDIVDDGGGIHCAHVVGVPFLSLFAQV